MGFIDKAKNKMNEYKENFGEEKIKEVDWDEPVDREDEEYEEYDEIEEMDDEDYDQQDSSHSSHRASYDDDDDEDYDDYYDDEDDDESVKKEKKKTDWGSKFSALKNQAKSLKKNKGEDEDDDAWEDDDDDDVFLHAKVDPDKAREKRKNDTLEALGIPTTFDVPSNVFMKDDLTNGVDFDYLAPKGFDIAQVQSFVSRVAVSVKFYQDRLEDRKKHIATLADIIDRQSIDNQNLKYELGKNQGVSIVATSSHDDLEAENNLLIAENSKLRKEKDALRSELVNMKNSHNDEGTSSSSNEWKEKYEELEDQYVALMSENERLKNENIDLQKDLRLEEEDEIAESFSSSSSSFSDSDNDDLVDIPEGEERKTVYAKRRSSVEAESEFLLDDDDDDSSYMKW